MQHLQQIYQKLIRLCFSNLCDVKVKTNTVAVLLLPESRRCTSETLVNIYMVQRPEIST
jgi:hypothetical protein